MYFRSRIAKMRNARIKIVVVLVLFQLAGLADRVGGQEAQCVPVNAPDYGTCAGLDSDCCSLWLMECSAACSSMLLPDPAAIPADQEQKFSCRGQTITYKCKCSGDTCPKSYCASSQCLPESGNEYSCDLPCSPQDADVLCPAGKIPRFVKSFPTCPEHTPRYSCQRFNRCESAKGQALNLPNSVDSAPNDGRRSKNSTGRVTTLLNGSGALPVLISLFAVLAAR